MRSPMVFGILVLFGLLFFGCCSLTGVEEAAMVSFRGCPEGGKIKLYEINETTGERTGFGQDLLFSGWQNDTCTLAGILNSCNYTRAEAEGKSLEEFEQILQERCFKKKRLTDIS